MGQYSSISTVFQPSKPLPPDTIIKAGYSPFPLMLYGLNIPVNISTASIFRQPNNPSPLPLKTISVMAHFDTGASITSIDIEIAKYLGLIPVGQSPSQTAAGIQIMPNYVIDISFPNTQLSSLKNLPIGSAKLNFKHGATNDPKNMGLLIGRNIMALWNIVWNGPTSSVFISD
ncbi:cellular and retroviral pepsin-like aspartate proteases [Candidatus Termititenax aidoneus]|uniref:Cellular and retroviral pepsin-like aspartate proteases n=1 Tax=Termititenax aidoneus TaxID=2218524 RepID=A0A388TCB0_TERA1|nr:cellular and retroviral pepsin-like aspartate proteases [Candidatus Termititenax aidoneus]